eukprot:GCRY01004234.1.p1 GENE.GCRY01004234.1~~GCRY01004234.1.p1  ORF type:complete len:279 (+),score=44.30 GCRY01004234.1:61-897(+)
MFLVFFFPILNACLACEWHLLGWKFFDKYRKKSRMLQHTLNLEKNGIETEGSKMFSKTFPNNVGCILPNYYSPDVYPCILNRVLFDNVLTFHGLMTNLENMCIFPFLSPFDPQSFMKLQPNQPTSFSFPQGFQNPLNGDSTSERRVSKPQFCFPSTTRPVLRSAVTASSTPSNPTKHVKEKAVVRKGSSGPREPSKRRVWTPAEHHSFVLGLKKYGRGSWVQISKFMKTRTPSQVQSHAHKYYIHQALIKEGKKVKRSINNIGEECLRKSEVPSHREN